ncbi:isochorismatase [Priestia flexa]|jgi:bifunctional isochorismate lyase / aryl carrier protein|uniref:isochorismatase n=2 Tax=Priestia TaxID=2800373 RepID=A0A0V8JNF9_9BACI|nr:MULTISPECIES: isochorismatase [Bacillaceae]KSU88601.1 Isochorismatase [Priestia veravalensis]KZB91934.1 isochorismatase [Bacillus sp. VT 712]MBN8251054.1 isochorismatase [Priestia flexa]MBN8433271.1 isochorismatase [Priestia flexa]MCA0965797.1 isochorismatase [Priestia flexa]
MAIPAITPYVMPEQSNLPKNKVSWSVNPNQAVLLIHDMQQYFLNNYTLSESPIPELIEHVKALKEKCIELGIPVVYTAQPGNQKLEDRALLTDFWGPGLEDDPTQTKVIDELAPNENDTVLTKWRYSAFKRTKLKEIMKQQDRNQLIITGVYAHIGCLTTANEAFMEDIQSFLVADAIADFSLEHHKMAIQYAAERCAVTASTAQVLDQLQANTSLVAKGFTLDELKEEVAKLLEESTSEIKEDENLIDRGLDSIRMMSLVETLRGKGVDVNFMTLAEEPTILKWWELVLDKQLTEVVNAE